MVLFCNSICFDAAFATVSVVIIACAAANQLSAFKSETAPGRPALTRSIGNGSRITPVEKGSICDGCRSSIRAPSRHVSWARLRPSAPVPALAQPVLIISARMPALVAKYSRHKITGAAQKRFCVKTPATFEFAARRITSRSLRLALRMPASVMPSSTPGTGNKFLGSGGLRLTGI